MVTWYNINMKNVNLHLKNKEDQQLIALAKIRLKRLKEGKAKLISHKEVWK